MQMQEEVELKVFREFVAASGLAVRPGTITHRHPPEPDITCEVEGEGTVGFEITELIDFGFMERLDLMGKTQKALMDFWWTALPSEQSTEFRRKYAHALLHFRFGSTVGLNKRRAAFARIFDALLVIPDDFTGDALRFDPGFLPVLEVVSIRRGSFVGPMLDVDNFGWIGDPTETTISKKLSKTYACDYPIDLLAYVDWDILPPEGAWKASAEEAAKALLTSQLRRIWVFDRCKQQVLANLP